MTRESSEKRSGIRVSEGEGGMGLGGGGGVIGESRHFSLKKTLFPESFIIMHALV